MTATNSQIENWLATIDGHLICVDRDAAGEVVRVRFKTPLLSCNGEWVRDGVVWRKAST